MHIYITICITLLTMIAGMHLLLKAKAQEAGSIFKLISYFIILVGLLILICQVVRGISMMRHHDGEGMEHSHMFMKHHMMGGMNCCMGMYGHGNMGCCEMEESGGNCCGEMMNGDSTHMKMECKEMMMKGDKDKEGEKEPETKPEKK